jgi:hypothetical protein
MLILFVGAISPSEKGEAPGAQFVSQLPSVFGSPQPSAVVFLSSQGWSIQQRNLCIISWQILDYSIKHPGIYIYSIYIHISIYSQVPIQGVACTLLKAGSSKTNAAL